MKLKLPAFAIDWLINRAKKTPFDHLTGYMNRYWVLNPKGKLSRFGTARIHEILRSDADRHLHDHPWSYTTIILKGGYTEVTHWETMEQAEQWARKERRQGGMFFNSEMGRFELRLMYEAGCVLHRKAGFPHRLVVSEGESATTLFMMGNYQNKWGFYTPEGKIYWRDYLDEQDVTKRAAVIKAHYPDQAKG
jgi:hypothetical protein